MSEFDAETALLLTRVGTQVVAFSLDDVVRISPCDPKKEIASESELRETAAQRAVVIDEHAEVPVLDLAQHLEEAAIRATCVLECVKGHLLVAETGTVQPLGGKLVCELPELVRETVYASGVQRLIWDESLERWRLWLSSDRLLDHADTRPSAETVKEAA